MASVHFDQVTHRTPGDFDALVDLRLSIGDGELVALVGGPGSGSSTVLRLVAGLEDPDRGVVSIDGRDVAGVAPRDRQVALVLPHHALYPNLTTLDHLEFPLVISGVAEHERRRRIDDVAARLRLDDVLDRRPAELTCAQCQRVALGRAIVRRPRVLLLDEPFAGVDDPLKGEVRRELERLRDDIGTTMIVVVADRVDGFAVGDRIVHFDRGRAHEALIDRIPA